MGLILKDPGALLDYEIDWGADYLADDSLVDSQWSVFPIIEGGIEVASSDFDATTAKVSVSGGLPGQIYRLSNEVQTQSGQSDRRSIMLRVEMR